MQSKLDIFLRRTGRLAILLLLFLGACRKSETGVAVSSEPPKPKVAAAQLDQAFQSASPELQQETRITSEALRAAEYDKAVELLQDVRDRPNLTFEQGMAVHNAEVALESQLIAGVAAGDPKAKLAYERLKKSRRE